MSVDGIASGVFAADLPETGGQIFFASAVEHEHDVCRTAIGKKTGRKTAETEHCSEEFCSIYWRF